METWERINQRLSNFVGDAEAAVYKLPLRVTAFNLAQDELLHHTARERSVSLELNSDDTLDLPDDWFCFGAIMDSTHQRWLYDRDNVAVLHDADTRTCWQWGGKLYFEGKPRGPLSVRYYACWPHVTLGGDESVVQGDVYIPQWAMLGTLHLTAAICLTPEAIKAAKQRNMNIVVDSGKPTDNALSQQAREHYWWWSEMLHKFPPQSRLGAVSQ